jgi:hypothetical protein
MVGGECKLSAISVVGAGSCLKKSIGGKMQAISGDWQSACFGAADVAVCSADDGT